MKKLLLLIIVIIAAQILNAQDIIKTTDEKYIKAKVESIEIDAIRYKKYDNQDGVTYTIKKSNVLSITYESGYIDIFDNKSIKSKRNEIQLDYLSAKKKRNVGVGILVGGVGVTAIGSILLATANLEQTGKATTGVVFIGIGSVSFIGGVITSIVGGIQMKIHGHRLDNLTLLNTDNIKLGMALYGNGIELKLNF